jgi:hypothetical protein
MAAVEERSPPRFDDWGTPLRRERPVARDGPLALTVAIAGAAAAALAAWAGYLLAAHG